MGLFPLRLIPRFGKLAQYLPSILKDFGIYEGNRFQEAIGKYLAKKGEKVFGDLIIPGLEADPKYRYKLRVIASDVTAGRMLILPDDIAEFGIDPDELSIAFALRMSMSIPFFFEPARLYNPKTKLTHVIVDGGILSNYPVWLFDVPPGQSPEWPTFGFNLYEPQPDGPADPFRHAPHAITSPIGLVTALWDATFSYSDQRYISKRHWARTIAIDAKGIGSTNFNLTEFQKNTLLDSGRAAARSFLKDWDFEEYVRTWRSSP
ncbi:MAG: phospholipase [SAR202 cluster bacterium]|nr:phospholipase [SAR202 cluster bacterium]